MPTEPFYTDPDTVREVTGIAEEVLDDAEAGRLILAAEDIIDSLLGSRVIDFETGRKIRSEDADDMQWEKLQRATSLLVGFLFRNPGWEMEQKFLSSSGDVSLSSPTGSPFPQVTMLLNQSGLRRLTGRATARSRSAPSDLPRAN
jgi:hypothetical protein